MPDPMALSESPNIQGRFRVSQDTVNRILAMGQARAIEMARSNQDPEFREAVFRIYPQASQALGQRPEFGLAASGGQTPAPMGTMSGPGAGGPPMAPPPMGQPPPMGLNGPQNGGQPLSTGAQPLPGINIPGVPPIPMAPGPPPIPQTRPPGMPLGGAAAGSGGLSGLLGGAGGGNPLPPPVNPNAPDPNAPAIPAPGPSFPPMIPKALSNGPVAPTQEASEASVNPVVDFLGTGIGGFHNFADSGQFGTDLISTILEMLGIPTSRTHPSDVQPIEPRQSRVQEAAGKRLSGYYNR